MFLMEKFHELYLEMLALEAKMASPMNISAPDARKRLVQLVDRQKREAERQLGQYGMEMYTRASYAMAAFVDEHFLREESPAHEAWTGNLLESALFKSERAGEKLFNDIDDLTSERTPAAAELARIYLAVLGLGFQGQYRAVDGVMPFDAEESLREYRRKLYQLVYGRDAVSLVDDDKFLPRAYGSTLDDASSSELPYLRPWIWALAGVVVLWLALGQALWSYSTAGVASEVDQIRSSAAGSQVRR